jgi:hypothetical protein
VLTITLTCGGIREIHVADSAEGSRIASMPVQPRQRPLGHLRQRESESAAVSRPQVTHTYDRTWEKHLPQAWPAAHSGGNSPSKAPGPVIADI